MDTKPIASTFSPKSDIKLTQIMEKYNLHGRDVNFVLTKLTMFFSRGEITEKELINFLQKEINVSPQTAEQISKEIKNNLIPTLWDKMPEEEKESLLHQKIETANNLNEDEEKNEVSDPNKDFHKNNPPPKKIKDFETIEKIAPQENKKPIQKTSPDNYREPIE